MSTPGTTVNPVSPKVVAATIWAVAGPVLVALVAALIDWIATDNGHSWLATLPNWVQFTAPVVIAAASSAIAGYRTRDPLRIVNGI